MILDPASLSETSELNSDICIIGAGAAGIALCSSLLDSNYSIILLESGDFSEEENGPFLRGRNAGSQPFSIGGQRRRVAGGMNDWSGNCSLLDKTDFDASPRFPSNWPVSFEELDQYTSKVEHFLKLDSRFSKGSLASTSNAAKVSFQDKKSPNSFLKEKTFLRSKIKVPSAQLDAITKADSRVKIITGASVGEINTNENRTHTDSVTAVCDDKTITIRSKVVVIAAGLENAPILMRTMSQDESEEPHPLPAVGHFLHSHLMTLQGFFIPRQGIKIKEYCLPGDLGTKGKERAKSFKGLQVADELRNEKNMLNGTMFLSPVTPEALLIPDEVRAEAGKLLAEEKLPNDHPIYAVRHYLEQIPRKHNHISLGKPWGKSPFPRPEYHWQIDEEEMNTMKLNLEVLSDFMEENDLGEVYDRSCGAEQNQSILTTNAHPMGGTTMGSDRESSVVDQNCRVHGFDNLFTLGGSVIPRSGACMVTSVILQLSFRLSDHLKEVLD